jgi:LEA14-like dessication related protein
LTTPALPGCAVYQAYAQRAAIRNAEFSIRNVQFLGVDLMGVNLLITLQLENPTDTPIEMDRMEYTLYVNEAKAFQGEVVQRVKVPSRQGRPLPIRISLAYTDLGNQVRQLLVTQRVNSWRLHGTAFFETPFGTLDYPVRVEQTQGQQR